MRIVPHIARFCQIILALAAAFIVLALEASAANCNITSVGKTPINDLGAGLYLNQFAGGLYPGGSNDVPAAHAAAGVNHAAGIAPLDAQGQPSPSGKYILLSIGMSNTTQEFQRFMQLAAANPQVNHATLKIIDGAAGGRTADTWDSPTDQNYDRIRDTILNPQGLSELQVQAAWVKVANAGPQVSLPAPNSDAYTLLQQQGNIVRALKVRYPNIKVVFLASRVYAGYASTTLNPEPYAYESGFAVKWLIEAQINQMSGGGVDPIAGDLDDDTVAPWIAWGPYLWADGLTPRSDGLIWQCGDFQPDGTHPSDAGRSKVANMLLNFLLTSPFSQPWFKGPNAADINQDGVVNTSDLLLVINHWGPCPQPCPPDNCPADVTHNCVVNTADLLAVINNWG